MPRVPSQKGGGHTLDEVILRDEEAGGPEAHQHQQLQEPEPAGQVTSVGQSPDSPTPGQAPWPVLTRCGAVLGSQSWSAH